MPDNECIRDELEFALSNPSLGTMSGILDMTAGPKKAQRDTVYHVSNGGNKLPLPEEGEVTVPYTFRFAYNI
jgi:hypothetical protein